MNKKLIIAQDIKELKYIISNIGHLDYICLPLSLEVQIYCQVHGISFINLSKKLNNSFHSKIQNEVDKIIKKNTISFLKLESIKYSYYQWLEYKLTTILFLFYSIRSLKNFSDLLIYTSGWNSDLNVNGNYYFLTRTIKNLFPKLKIISCSEYKKFNYHKYEKLISYKIKDNIPKNKKKLILFSNLGYGFKSLISNLTRKRHKVTIIYSKNIAFFKKVMLYFLNYYYVEIIKIKTKKLPQLNLPKIFFKKNDISNIVYHNRLKIISFFLDLENKVNIFKKFLQKKKPNLVISNIANGFDGGILEISNKLKVKTFNIPHGTISEYFNSGGKKFNQNISKAIFSKFAINAIQSKISKKFVKKFLIPSRLILETGNLVFNEQKVKLGNSILYAETNKGILNYRCYGFQTYYEYLDNLEILNKIAKNRKLNILVKPHPNIFYLINLLKKKFRHLSFTRKRNEELFKKIRMIISFSSSIIEDGLYSKIPIILFDRHRRYKHCYSNLSVNKKNAAVYYVNDKKKLITCINTIYNSNQINFNEYIDSNNRVLNFEKVLNRLL